MTVFNWLHQFILCINFIVMTLLIWLLVMKDLLSSFLLECQVKPLNHSHGLPPPGKKGRPYICSCMIYLRPTTGAKLVLKKWIEEMQIQPWSRAKKANDQPAFNWALNKTAGQVHCFLLFRILLPCFRTSSRSLISIGVPCCFCISWLIRFHASLNSFSRKY